MAKVTATGWGAAGTNADDPNYFEEQEKQWPGRASSTSTKKPVSSPKKKPAVHQSPAPTTEHHSSQAHKGSSSAGSAGTSPATKQVRGKGDK